MRNDEYDGGSACVFVMVVVAIVVICVAIGIIRSFI